MRLDDGGGDSPYRMVIMRLDEYGDPVYAHMIEVQPNTKIYGAELVRKCWHASQHEHLEEHDTTYLIQFIEE